MQSDLFDKKVREAAENHHPAYDEQAWKRMLHLLDKFLPEDKDRRRGIFFLVLLFLLIGGGIVWYTTRPGSSDKTIAKTENAVSKPGANKTAAETTPAGDNVNIQRTPVSEDNNQVAPANRPTPYISPENVREQGQGPLTLNRKSATQLRKGNVSTKNNVDEIVRNNNEEAVKSPVFTDPPTNVANAPLNIDQKIEPVVAETKISAETEPKKAEQPVTNENARNNIQKKNRQPLPLFASVTMGPDVSFAGTSELGQTKLLAGVGIGYTFMNRLTVRTGFYSARKVYTASPDEYNPPAEFWTWYPYLQKVDANCKVYEIPLMVSYDFGRSTKQKWFASAGISSILMKEEAYDYYYKYYPSSPTYMHKYTIKDENKHPFSVLTLSGGYKRNISDRVFVMAEPYFKLSLQGLGYGKVKLNSGGIMISAGIKPFSSQKSASAPKPR